MNTFKMIFDLDTGIKLFRIKSQDVRFFYVIELRILCYMFCSHILQVFPVSCGLY